MEIMFNYEKVWTTFINENVGSLIEGRVYSRRVNRNSSFSFESGFSATSTRQLSLLFYVSVKKYYFFADLLSSL